MSERPTFSPLWHRVRALKPRLRPHTQVTRQHYRGRRWHVVHDPASNQFYRLSPVAYQMIGLLDGQRTVEEVWNIALENHGDGAPTQQEVIELLGQMYNANLLALDAAPETEQLLRRGRDRLKKKLQQQAIGIMYLRIRMFNPDRYLTAIEPVLRPLLNRWGFLAWTAWVLFCLYNLLPHWESIKASFSDAIAPANLIWLSVVFIVIKAIHETGHGVICKRFGGQVPEFGMMLLVLFPAPYVDASSAWSFTSKWKRIGVGAGGMIFELAIAGAASLYWVNTLNQGSTLAHQLAFNIMLLAGFTTLLFNANPLMRFDGYYILSDALEVPNLMQRSMKMLQYLFQKYIYRLEQTRSPSTVRGEQAILVVYGILALAYRIFLFFSITLFVMGRMFAIGLLLAIWTAAAWFLLPGGKFIHWLASSQQLVDRRVRTILTTLGLTAAVLFIFGVIPLPDHRRAAGVVESVQRSGVYFGADGFVTVAHKRLGDRVQAGEVILELRSDDLETRYQVAKAELAESEALEREYLHTRPDAAPVIADRIATQRQIISVIETRLGQLKVRAPHDGVLVAGSGSGVDPGMVVGAMVRRGQGLCEVVDVEHVRVVASLTTAQAAPLIELPADGYEVQLRPVSRPTALLKGSSVSIIEAGQRLLPHPALGSAGGGTIELDKKDQTGRTTVQSQFMVRVDNVSWGEHPWLGAPGERIKLRFRLPSKPLLSQWVDRLQKLMQGRVNL
jgi:putative peptide zinc metalloprotease protein